MKEKEEITLDELSSEERQSLIDDLVRLEEGEMTINSLAILHRFFPDYFKEMLTQSKEERLLNRRLWWQRNRGKLNAYQKKYCQKPEIKAQRKAYYQRPEVKERIKAYALKWRSKPGYKERQRKRWLIYSRRPEVAARIKIYRERADVKRRNKEWYRENAERLSKRARERYRLNKNK